MKIKYIINNNFLKNLKKKIKKYKAKLNLFILRRRIIFFSKYINERWTYILYGTILIFLYEGWN